MLDQYPAIIGGIVAIVGAFLTPILIAHGVDASGAGSIVSGLGAIFTSIVSIVAVAFTHRKVTPLANPKTNDGTMLVPVTIPSQDTGTVSVLTPPESDPATTAANEAQSAEDTPVPPPAS